MSANRSAVILLQELFETLSRPTEWNIDTISYCSNLGVKLEKIDGRNLREKNLDKIGEQNNGHTLLSKYQKH